jgi:8-amino-7-oxononanoate synthase
VTESLNTADAPAETPADAPERDLMSKFDGLIAERQALLDTGVTDPFAIVMEQVKSPTEAVIKGKDTILLGTYNYMGMTFDPDVIQAGKDALDQFGSGTNGSRMLNGTFRDHMEVEEALREFYGVSGAIVFSTGYMANLGMISTLAGKGEYVILDADSHASIYDGCKQGNAEIVRFRHNASRISTSASAACRRKPASWWCSRASIRCSATSPR